MYLPGTVMSTASDHHPPLAVVVCGGDPLPTGPQVPGGGTMGLGNTLHGITRPTYQPSITLYCNHPYFIIHHYYFNVHFIERLIVFADMLVSVAVCVVTTTTTLPYSDTILSSLALYRTVPQGQTLYYTPLSIMSIMS